MKFILRTIVGIAVGICLFAVVASVPYGAYTAFHYGLYEGFKHGLMLFLCIIPLVILAGIHEEILK